MTAKDVKVVPEELHDGELDSVHGGIALLLPAVQQAREAARSNGGAGGKLHVDGDFGPATQLKTTGDIQ